MFNSLTLYIILGLSASTLGFGYLSYHFYGDKIEAESALVQVIHANTEIQKSLNLQVKSCEISDVITSEYQAEKQIQQDKVQAVISKIDSIPKKANAHDIPRVKPDAEIDIDNSLPDSIIVLLRSSCIQGETNACIRP
jgi:hypothetical protein